jgi:hypothetical protein
MAEAKTARRQRPQEQKPLRFDQQLVLNLWILNLLEADSLENLAKDLKDPFCEGLDENNISYFHHQLVYRLYDRVELPKDVLLAYDENIVRHTQTISATRRQPIQWKYFQYLSLLFAEIYLDRLFRDERKLLRDLNAFVAEFNKDKTPTEEVAYYKATDLNKLAFWNATGSGKTLLMHVNILQYKLYLQLHGREKELNRIILLTPNEGLSLQHRDELDLSGIAADLFSKDATNLFSGDSVVIIDIHKLREDMGEKTVAVDAFEGNNLVLVDEGHRGASGVEWKSRRDSLCEHGFSFEYSATFGQAMKASGNKALKQEYAKCILFDYSYKYFYKDGFGKDYRILDLSDDSDEEKRRFYLTACLLAFYQQQRLYEDRRKEFQPYLIERPLWIFVGGSVNAVRTQGKRKVSDVLDILLFLAEFVRERRQSVSFLQRLLSGKPGLLDMHGRDVFANVFSYLVVNGISDEQLYCDVLRVLFNSDAQAALHVENLKGAEGEIAIRLGENDPFAVVNVGDADKLCKLCEEHPEELKVGKRDFSGSLFNNINDLDSTINLLIGSKKFTEGWNSWRVSTMGLMNIGKTEGSEIIQLFGRGVRLKGYNFGLKRSAVAETGTKPPQHINILETLNIFGVRAHYMMQFKEYLEEEGLPANEERIEFILPVVKNLGQQKLKVVDVEKGLDFKKDAPKPTLDLLNGYLMRYPVVINWYPRLYSQQSRGAGTPPQEADLKEGKLAEKHLAFMDMNAVFFELQRFKNERAFHNLNLSRPKIERLLYTDGWYVLLIPPEELEFDTFRKVRQWQEIAVALLKKYCDRYYKFKKEEWERDHLEYRELTPDDPNFIEQYRILLDESQKEIASKLQEIKEAIVRGDLNDIEWGNLHAVMFANHLYRPLLYLKSELVEVSPVPLNEGERDFVLDLRAFHLKEQGFFHGKELYLLRNQSRGKGIGFFEAGNFYPDFILWLLTREKQYVTFIDPKGIRNLQGENDPKILFYETIKEIERRLGDPNVVLNSFIISQTPPAHVGWWGGGMTKAQFEERHVLFPSEDKSSYTKKLLSKILETVPMPNISLTGEGK